MMEYHISTAVACMNHARTRRLDAAACVLHFEAGGRPLQLRMGSMREAGLQWAAAVEFASRARWVSCLK